ncbi:MAG: hypothetical protein U0P81_02065 [Holophagaceae bacterium]
MPEAFQTQQGLGWRPVGVLLALCFLVSLFSANPALTLASVALLLVLVKLFWRPGEPPILLFAMVYHWLQGCLLTLSANLQNRPLDQLPGSPLHTLGAAWLTLLGILAVALGLRVGAGPSRGLLWQAWRDRSETLFSIRRLFLASLFSIVASEFLTNFGVLVAGLRQPLLALANLHWVVVFAFTYIVMARGRGFGLLAVVSVIELLIGFTGYFSGFKTILLILALGILTHPKAFRGPRLPVLVGLGVATTLALLLWTAIKREYRAFLNQGSGDQVVLVPMEQRVAKLAELSLAMTTEQYAQAVEDSADRITYIKFFAESMGVVPDQIPHENGLLWWQALVNAVVPRLLNPDKAILDDSARTSYYTGGFVSGVQEGASISLGYIAESYIDLGPVGMVFPLFCWGWFVGFVYRVMLRSSPNLVFNYGCATALVVVNACFLETSNVKMVGGLLLGFLVLLLFNRKGAQRLLGWLAARPVATYPSRRSGPVGTA